ncbi:MAG: hypothetical protein ACRYFL_12465 [Janthinobacterium lividum]
MAKTGRNYTNRKFVVLLELAEIEFTAFASFKGSENKHDRLLAKIQWLPTIYFVKDNGTLVNFHQTLTINPNFRWILLGYAIPTNGRFLEW